MKQVTLDKLTEDSVGSSVTYLPKNERGVITSFNSRFVFVCYDDTGRGVATCSRDLVFN